MRLKCWLLCAAILTSWLGASAVGQESVRWQLSLETAKRLALQTNRMLLVHFWSDWCSHCKRMDKEVFARPEVATALESSFVPVSVNGDHFPHTARQFGVSAMPTDVIITPQGQLVDRIVGAQDASEYLARLNRVAARMRNPMTSVAERTASGPSRAAQQAPTSRPELPNPQRFDPGDHNLTAPSADRYADRAAQQGPPLPWQGQPQQTSRLGPQGRLRGLAGSGQTQPRAEFGWPQGSAAAPSTEPSGAVAARTVSPGPPYGRVYPRLDGAESMADAGRSPWASRRAGVETSPPSVALSPPSGTSPPHDIPVAAPTVQLPPGNPPLGLDGFCPVELTENGRWVPGDLRWGLTHRGRTYLFAGPAQRDRFDAEPDLFAPVASGNDVVLLVDEGRVVPGRREDGVFYSPRGGLPTDRRVLLFSSQATRARFTVAPQRYLEAAQARSNMARRPGGVGRSAGRAPWDLSGTGPR